MNTYFQNDAQLAIPMKITDEKIVRTNKIEIDLRLLLISSSGSSGQTKSQVKTRLVVGKGFMTMQIKLTRSVDIPFLYMNMKTKMNYFESFEPHTFI